VPGMLVDDQAALLAEATAWRDARTRGASTLEEAAELAESGFVRLPWRAFGSEGEERLAREGVTVRCLIRNDGEPVEEPDDDGVDALVARAY
jgi:prolyl-tRNA synthetase